MTIKHCQLCGHADLFRRRTDGRCGFSTQGVAGFCGCQCIYSDALVLVRIRESGHYLLREIDNASAEMTPDRAQAAQLTLEGARWFGRRCPFAIDIEVLR